MTGRAPRRAGPNRDTRERILDAALELFGAKGFAATTTKEESPSGPGSTR